MNDKDGLPTTEIGQSGIVCTRLGLGTGPLGGMYKSIDASTARSTVISAYRLGMTLFDTAPLYGYGTAEEHLGSGLVECDARDITIATKVGYSLVPKESAHDELEMFETDSPFRFVFDFSSDAIRQSLEESRERIGRAIDLVYIHDPVNDYDQALSETYPLLCSLRDAGVIRGIGVGTDDSDLLCRFALAADFDAFLLAGRYTLLDQRAVGELLPLCVEKGISVVLGGVFNSGILAEWRNSPMFDYQAADFATVKRVQRLDEVCAEYGVPLKAAALQFPLGHEAISVVLPGARSSAEVEENVRMFNWDIPAEMWKALRDSRLIAETAAIPHE